MISQSLPDLSRRSKLATLIGMNMSCRELRIPPRTILCITVPLHVFGMPEIQGQRSIRLVLIPEPLLQRLITFNCHIDILRN